MDNITIVGSDCCGCNSCYESCPVSAIHLFQNDEGFLYPRVDAEKCIVCGKCINVCPALNYHQSLHKNHTCYLSFNKDASIVRRSSSGGLFTAVASYVLERNGVVYGPAYDKQLELSYRRVSSKKDLSILVGSKYVQANSAGIFDKIKEDLKAGIFVLFSGTPCQVSGLINFLRRDYDNLLTIDLMCHGVPSPGLFKKCVSFIEDKYRGKVVDYRFRDKSVLGWSSGSSSIVLEKNGKHKVLRYDNALRAYFLAFIKGLSLRASCYSCHFSSFDRAGDITLGDFWYAEKLYNEDSFKKGVNLLLVNSLKGEKIVKSIYGEIYLKEVCDKDALVSNPHLEHPVNVPCDRFTHISSVLKGDYNSFIHYVIPKHIKLLPIYYRIKIFLRNIFS